MRGRTARAWALVAGPAFAVAAGLGLRFGVEFEPAACWTAGITALCAVWWISEALPIPATALVPFAAFPLTGVLTHRQVAGAYGDTLILLFLGGFLLSAAMERSGAHRRLALGMVRLVGGVGGRRLVLGFMLASAALSMWITNTATALMLLPIALAVLQGGDEDRLAVPLLLGVAYGASIGGLGTPIGSPPNGIFIGVHREVTGEDFGFVDWMRIGVPVVALFLPLAWWWLTRGLRGSRPLRLPPTTAWRAAEARVLVVFALTACAWVTREGPSGGWSGLLGLAGTVDDSTVALAAAVALFVVSDGRGGRLLDWETAARIPWGILVLFGGGIAIARAFVASGLSDELARGLVGLARWPMLAMLLALCLVVTFLTEVTSNTATASVLMPLLAAAGTAAGADPTLMMIPAALSCSCAFMLPVATPPNAIVFGSGRVPIRAMAREGAVLNLIGAGVITLVVYWLS